MNKKAFTLIELMIVVAILAIALFHMFPVVKAMKDEALYGQKHIAEAEELTRFFLHVKKELKTARKIVDLDMARVLFDNDLSIKFSSSGKSLSIGNVVFKLPGMAKIGNLQPFGETAFMTDVFTGADTVKVLWKVGE